MSNKQMDIFDPKYRASIQAEQNKETGMMLATEHAKDHEPDWDIRAMEELKSFIRGGPGEREPFMAEDIREWAMGSIPPFPEPPGERAWGSIIRKASKEGLIVFVGYAKTTNPKAHLTPAAVWRRA